LSNRIDLNLEMQVAMMPEYFDRFEGGAEMEAIATLSAGLSVKLGTTEFAVIEPMDYALLNNMNEQINVLKAISNELSQRPESCPECPELIEETIIVNNLNNIVYFTINSCNIKDDQQINIYNTAEFIKSTDTPITVVGFADKDTGDAAYNLKLSEERAKAVAKELMNKYDIPSEMITVEWKGSDVQPYGTNKWNRVVIMQTE
jgi:outer membrane protein OmpA-like peptidoglycan-associated protein